MRAPRRSFASPFVVTTLAALPIAACNPPPHRNPPGPHVTPTPTNDKQTPPPTTDKPPVVMENPPRPTPDPGSPEPPKTGPATTLSWHVTRKGSTCTAHDNNACKHNIPAGQPVPPCNPPPPRVAKCPDGLADGASVTVTQFANQPDCFVAPTEMPKCPPNVSCNPPPPRKVACP